MAFTENVKFQLGDTVVTTRAVSGSAGYFTVGTRVRIVGISSCGYDLADENGNRVIECGWDCVRKV